MSFDRELDILGLQCPNCALELCMELGEMVEGQILRVITDDPSTTKDFPRLLAVRGHTLLSEKTTDNEEYIFVIQVGLGSTTAIH